MGKISISQKYNNASITKKAPFIVKNFGTRKFLPMEFTSLI